MQKRTERTVVFLVPSGTRTQKVRRFVRDSEGAEHPEDYEVNVPKYREETVPFDADHLAELPYMTEERLRAWAADKFGVEHSGVLIKSISDRTYHRTKCPHCGKDHEA